MAPSTAHLAARMIGMLWVPLVLAACDGGDGAEEGRGGHRGEAARRVVSVKLTRRAPPSVVAACREASGEQSLRVAVVCPNLVPDVRIVTEKDVPNVMVAFPPDYYELTFNTAVPSPRHWVVGMGRAAAAKEEILRDESHEVKGLPKFLERLSVGNERVDLYWYPPPGGAVHRGHVIAFVRRRGLAVWASIHGRRYSDAAVAMALDLARGLRTTTASPAGSR